MQASRSPARVPKTHQSNKKPINILGPRLRLKPIGDRSGRGQAPPLLYTDGSAPQAVYSRGRSEEHTSELQHQIISYAVFCLKKKNKEANPSVSSRPQPQ